MGSYIYGKWWVNLLTFYKRVLKLGKQIWNLKQSTTNNKGLRITMGKLEKNSLVVAKYWYNHFNINYALKEHNCIQ